MASWERDPEVCAEKIAKRQQLLIKLHEENKFELEHPALIREEDKPIEAECKDPMCVIAKKTMTKEEQKKALVIKILGITISILVIIALVIAAVMIGKM
ncbi:hypothetical protein [Mycoplasmopsis felifaucium]|uniref:hypothetical protein n=1 Tax=Mycoplasmopsis felifaucium TaxID=35768 RepID=UPI0004867A3E|nr:hypothetical protein [Mycoplasmopsis felifaucium]